MQKGFSEDYIITYYFSYRGLFSDFNNKKSLSFSEIKKKLLLILQHMKTRYTLEYDSMVSWT